MGWSYLKEVEICDDKVRVDFRDKTISFEANLKTEHIMLDESNAEEFIEALICACKCANIELINVGYK